jgi:hypothetical protein
MDPFAKPSHRHHHHHCAPISVAAVPFRLWAKGKWRQEQDQALFVSSMRRAVFAGAKFNSAQSM